MEVHDAVSASPYRLPSPILSPSSRPQLPSSSSLPDKLGTKSMRQSVLGSALPPLPPTSPPPPPLPIPPPPPHFPNNFLISLLCPILSLPSFPLNILLCFLPHSLKQLVSVSSLPQHSSPYLLSCLPCLLTSLPPSLPACLPACLPAYLPFPGTVHQPHYRTSWLGYQVPCLANATSFMGTRKVSGTLTFTHPHHLLNLFFLYLTPAPLRERECE